MFKRSRCDIRLKTDNKKNGDSCFLKAKEIPVTNNKEIPHINKKSEGFFEWLDKARQLGGVYLDYVSPQYDIYYYNYGYIDKTGKYIWEPTK